MYTSNISNITQFGFKSQSGCFLYSDRLNQTIITTINDQNISSITITFISQNHREIQRIDMKNYIVERIKLLDDDNYNTERFYGLIGKQGEDWVRILPDIEYPEFAVEYIGNEQFVHYFREEANMAITKEGIIIMYSNIIDGILFTVQELVKIGKLEPCYRKMIIRHILFDVKFYYSPADKEIIRFEDSDIQSEEDRKFIYRDSSNKEKIYLDTICIFESFSPEKRKQMMFKIIYDELIQTSHRPNRYYDWCLDSEDQLRISKLFNCIR
jgi:hypothetical protein